MILRERLVNQAALKLKTSVLQKKPFREDRGKLATRLEENMLMDI